MFVRNCVECKEFFFDEATGEVKKSPDGRERVRRPAAPDCSLCARWDAESGAPWAGFNEAEWRAFNVFKACEAFGVLPRAGGAEDQEEESMTTMLMLRMVKETSDRRESARTSSAALSVILGAFGGR